MLEQLFEKINSELLTDEVKLEMNAFFESAVNTAIAKKEEDLEEQNKADIAEFKDELVTSLDEYLTYFVEEFTRENEQQVEDAVKVKTAQRVLDVFEGVVNDFNMNLDENTVQNDEELVEAKQTISSQTEEILELRKQTRKFASDKIVESIASELDSEAKQEKFRTLAETITYTEDEDFKSKLGVLAETIAAKEEKPATRLDENLDDFTPPETKPDTRMSRYLKRL
jgi:hypothetical protein